MLKITIQGKKLDLKKDMTLEYNIKNPFFEDDTIPVPATYTFSVPPTANNNKLLAYPLRINQKTRLTEFEGEISYSAIVIARGILVRKKTKQNGDISLYFKAQTSEDLLDKPLCELPLKEYTLNSGDWLQNMIALCERSFRGEEPFALPMVRIKQPDNVMALFGASGEDNNFWQGIIIALAEKFGFAEPKVLYLNPFEFYWQRLPEGNKYYLLKKGAKLFEILTPFPFLWHIMDVVLSSLGISKNPFKDSGNLEKVIVSATYSPTDVSISESTPFRINKSLPDFNTGDFVKDVLKAFGFTLNRLRGCTNIIAYDEILKQDPIDDWTEVLVDGWTIEDEKREHLEAGIDTGVPEFTLDEGEKKTLVEVDTPYDLTYKLYLMSHNLTVDGVQYKKENINKTCWYIKLTREFYYSEAESGSVRFWVTFKGVKPFPSKTKSPLKMKNRKTNFKSPPMLLDFAMDSFSPDYTKMPVNGVYSGKNDFCHRYMYIPYIEAKRSERDFKPTLLSYIGKEQAYIPVSKNSSNVAPDPKYPMATSNGYNPWRGEGLDFSEIRVRSEVARQFFEKQRLKLKGEVVLSEKRIRKLTGIDVIICKGKRWLLQEINIPIKTSKIYPAKVTLVEIPDIDNMSFPKYNLWS